MTDIDVHYEPLPGYRLIERIGAGGYGEVWRAEAPGGLTKAIKFVFGQHNERRAADELRALERIKQVRHPFLLSLERIEVVDGRLLVVTELADGSIKDRFQACRQEGLPGIPRDELLGYLRDAADALDYMNEQHSLQHLDIKPENLLLLADHVKVADFGLVKDVQQQEVSLVGGMTPLYAAPEVFRGTPSRHSDQYSLAIVYQDMLTGTLPFAGTNAAELTLQHLHDEPDLSCLIGSDRYAVSRALAKDSQHRYATCREFVEALAKGPAKERLQSEQAWAEPNLMREEAIETTARQSSQTELFEEPCLPDEENLAPPRFALPPTDATVIDLPKIRVEAQDFEPLPTLFLGAGGLAGRVLTQLRRKMFDRYGTAVIPAMPMLLLDTDAAELAKTNGRTAGKLFAEETLVLPLRRPSHYRNRSQQLLGWLSRRWLYNIPRSLRTEGLRPLGRLALVDHARQTGQRIRRALMDAIDEQAVATSGQALERGFRTDRVRVYIVASISGGTGSGMAIDLGYLVRAVLEKLEVPSAEIVGVMMHATQRDPNHSELARVNAFSWLSEFNHFQQRGNPYLNDGSCCLPAHRPETAPFDHTYLVHLGDNMDLTDLDCAAQTVAEYLELDSLTPAQLFLDACRAQSASEAGQAWGQPVSLRSFGTFSKSAVAADLCDELATVVSRQVVALWHGPDQLPSPGQASSPTTAASGPAPPESSDPLDAYGGQLVSRLHLEPTGMAALAQTLLEAELRTDPATFVASWLASCDDGGSDDLTAIDRVFEGDEAAGEGSGTCALFGRPVAVIVRPLADKLRSEVRHWVIQHVEKPGQRLAGARRAADWLYRFLESAEVHLQRLRRNTATQLLVARNAPAAPQASVQSGKPSEENRALYYFQLRLHHLALLASRQMTGLILSDLQATTEELTGFGEQLGHFCPSSAAATDSTGRASSADPAAAEETLPDMVASVPREKIQQLSKEVDQQLQAEYLGAQHSLFTTVMEGGRGRAQLGAALHEFARKAVERAWAGVNVFGRDSANGAEPNNTLAPALKSATPTLLSQGGARRVLLSVPRDAADRTSEADATRVLGTEASVVPGADNSLTLCIEAERLPLVHIAADIVEYRRDRAEFADRVHSRMDVSWTPLLPATELPQNPMTGVPAAMPEDDCLVQQTQMI